MASRIFTSFQASPTYNPFYPPSVWRIYHLPACRDFNTTNKTIFTPSVKGKISKSYLLYLALPLSALPKAMTDGRVFRGLCCVFLRFYYGVAEFGRCAAGIRHNFFDSRHDWVFGRRLVYAVANIVTKPSLDNAVFAAVKTYNPDSPARFQTVLRDSQ